MKEYHNSEVLRKLYWGEGLSQRAVARKLGVSPYVVFYWMKKFNIPRRQNKPKLNITREILEKLYWEKGLTTIQIAEKFGISASTILNYMNKFSIPRRSKETRLDITKELLEKLYLAQKLSIRQMARKLNTTYQIIRYKLKKYGVRIRTYSEANMRHPKTPFSGNLKEKAYMLGLRAGDITAIRAKNQIRVRISTSHLSQVLMFKKVFEPYAHVGIYTSISNDIKEWNVHCLLDKSFDFLLEKPNIIPKWILDNEKYFYAFLAGYSDCEGYWQVYMRKTKTMGNKIGCRFRLVSGDEIILKQIFEKLKEAGFNTKFRLARKRGYTTSFGKTNKDMYELSINSKNSILSLAENLSKFSSHEEKIWKMKFILKNINKNWEDANCKLMEFKKFVEKTNLNKTSIQQLQSLQNATKVLV